MSKKLSPEVTNKVIKTLTVFAVVFFGCAVWFGVTGEIRLDIAPTSTKHFELITWEEKPLVFISIILVLLIITLGLLWARKFLCTQIAGENEV